MYMIDVPLVASVAEWDAFLARMASLPQDDPDVQEAQRLARKGRATAGRPSVREFYSPDQPRDDHGRWTSGPDTGSGSGGAVDHDAAFERAAGPPLSPSDVAVNGVAGFLTPSGKIYPTPRRPGQPAPLEDYHGGVAERAGYKGAVDAYRQGVGRLMVQPGLIVDIDSVEKPTPQQIAAIRAIVARGPWDNFIAFRYGANPEELYQSNYEMIPNPKASDVEPLIERVWSAPLVSYSARLFYNPDQPRVPAGEPDGGQWTSGGGGAAAPAGDGGVSVSPEIQQKLDEAQARADAMPVTHTIDTPERRALRERIVDKLYGSGAAVKGKEAWIVIGQPASGKNSAVSDHLVGQKGALMVDSDEIKKELPEYAGGIGANAVHEESSSIIQPAILAQAVANGDNIVMPRVGKSYAPLAADVQTLKDAGYKVHMVLVDVPDQVAIERALSRFLHTGRLVSLSYVKSVDGHPRNTYMRMKHERLGDSWTMYDNHVPMGQPAKLVEQVAA